MTEPEEPKIEKLSLGANVVGLVREIVLASGAGDTGDELVTSPIRFDRGLFNLSVAGEFSGSIRLERSFDSGDNWRTVQTFTEPVERAVANVEPTVLWRWAADADPDSGSLLARISQ